MRLHVNIPLQIEPKSATEVIAGFDSARRLMGLLFWALGALLVTLLVPATWAASSASLSQCGNLASGVATNCSWQNGNLNSNQAHWLEGDSVSYQLVLSGLTPNASYTVTIGYAT